METINHEYYVSLEVAKLLKEAGFDWECKAHYKQNGDFILRGYDCDWNATASVNPNVEYYSAPTLDVAQRWLREKTEYQVDVACVYINHKRLYSYSFYKGEYKNEILKEEFLTYEGAQEAGIKKALEIILEKGE